MKLPHLDQFIPFERGEAALLAHALAVLVHDSLQVVFRTHDQGERLTPATALHLKPLASLGKRLLARHRQELRKPPKPGKRPAARTLRVPYDELIAVEENRAALYYTTLAETEKMQLQRVLGEFQRYSLNLDCYIQWR